MNRPRYVILIWFHDHWAVNYETDDLELAKEVQAAAMSKVHALLIDTHKIK